MYSLSKKILFLCFKGGKKITMRSIKRRRLSAHSMGLNHVPTDVFLIIFSYLETNLDCLNFALTHKQAWAKWDWMATKSSVQRYRQKLLTEQARCPVHIPVPFHRLDPERFVTSRLQFYSHIPVILDPLLDAMAELNAEAPCCMLGGGAMVRALLRGNAFYPFLVDCGVAPELDGCECDTLWGVEPLDEIFGDLFERGMRRVPEGKEEEEEEGGEMVTIDSMWKMWEHGLGVKKVVDENRLRRVMDPHLWRPKSPMMNIARNVRSHTLFRSLGDVDVFVFGPRRHEVCDRLLERLLEMKFKLQNPTGHRYWTDESGNDTNVEEVPESDDEERAGDIVRADNILIERELRKIRKVIGAKPHKGSQKMFHKKTKTVVDVVLCNLPAETPCDVLAAFDWSLCSVALVPNQREDIICLPSCLKTISSGVSPIGIPGRKPLRSFARAIKYILRLGLSFRKGYEHDLALYHTPCVPRATPAESYTSLTAEPRVGLRSGQAPGEYPLMDGEIDIRYNLRAHGFAKNGEYAFLGENGNVPQ